MYEWVGFGRCGNGCFCMYKASYVCVFFSTWVKGFVRYVIKSHSIVFIARSRGKLMFFVDSFIDWQPTFSKLWCYRSTSFWSTTDNTPRRKVKSPGNTTTSGDKVSCSVSELITLTQLWEHWLSIYETVSEKVKLKNVSVLLGFAMKIIKRDLCALYIWLNTSKGTSCLRRSKLTFGCSQMTVLSAQFWSKNIWNRTLCSWDMAISLKMS